jgi:hypothetical protein
MAVMTQLGGWTIGAVSPVYFYRNFHALTPTGSASWAIRKMGHATSPFIVVVDRALPSSPRWLRPAAVGTRRCRL